MGPAWGTAPRLLVNLSSKDLGRQVLQDHGSLRFAAIKEPTVTCDNNEGAVPFFALDLYLFHSNTLPRHAPSHALAKAPLPIPFR